MTTRRSWSCNEHTRVIHISAGPTAPVAKEELLELVHDFGRAAGRGR